MINNPVTISSKMLIIMMGLTIITWFMYIGIIMLVIIGDAQLQMMTRVTVSLIDISEQLFIYDNIYTKIHTRGVDLNMIWNIYIKVQDHNKVNNGLGSGVWFTKILYRAYWAMVRINQLMNIKTWLIYTSMIMIISKASI